MNERIRELTRQVYGPSLMDHENFVMNNDKMERFAELIVEECIKLNGKELAMAGHSRMVDVYCEHFGIEL